MKTREQGFTLIELMIVVAIIAIIASIAIPNLLSARLNANESAAIATLKNISSSQAQCQASGAIDANNNGAGEYGFFAELSGAVAVRDDDAGSIGSDLISPAVLSGAFSNVDASRVLRSGYWFQMYLPDDAAAGTAEAATGGASGVVIEPANAEVLWMCYAWPASRGNTGNSAFFVNHSGDVLKTRNTIMNYDGITTTPVPMAAFLGTVSSPTMSSKVATNAAGQDGENWTVVN